MIHIFVSRKAACAKLECDICREKGPLFLAGHSAFELCLKAGPWLRHHLISCGWWSLASSVEGHVASADICPRCRNAKSSPAYIQLRNPSEN